MFVLDPHVMTGCARKEYRRDVRVKISFLVVTRVHGFEKLFRNDHDLFHLSVLSNTDKLNFV